ncbi:MAG: hypothetical protein ACYC7A_02930 [Thermoanaerobaculia bacterium]
MNRIGRTLLLAGAATSAFIALVHFAMVVMGASWYRWFGAPGLADEVERGKFWPTLITLAVALVFAVWSAYALAGANAIRRLPLLRTALVAIGVIYALRGITLIPMVSEVMHGTAIPMRYLVFSAVSLLCGIFYLAGTAGQWPALRRPAV